MFALFRLAFAPAPCLRHLTLLRNATRRIIMQKARPWGDVLADIAFPRGLVVGAWFQVLFTPLAGVLFTFPSRYWCTIGHLRVFSLGGWSPHIRTGLLGPRATRTATSGISRTGLSPTLVGLSWPFRYPNQCLKETSGEAPWACPRSLAATDGISFDVFSSGY